MNPLDWTAGPFLCLYFLIADAVLILLFNERNRLVPTTPFTAADELNTLLLAHLYGGPRHAANAALVGLVEAGAALPDRRSRKVRLDRFVLLPPELQPFGTIRNRDVTRDEFQSEFKPLFDHIEKKLIRRRLFPDTNEVARFR